MALLKLVAAAVLVGMAYGRPEDAPRPGYSYPAPPPPVYAHPAPYAPPPAPTYAPPPPAYNPPPPAPTYAPPPAPTYAPPPAKYEHKGMPYDFAYGVKDEYSGNNYGHNENSDGSTVTGEYRVLLPDGRTQIVTYTADHYKGYIAEVRYEGEAKYVPKYPEPSYKPAPIYGSPAA
ncbi:uncharacterized protein [Panulirus ornatus]|uniref:uncharacterized protein n=1 Tax=Panulirus ornatus TaxID=150431 RepID=UPI003A835BB3